MSLSIERDDVIQETWLAAHAGMPPTLARVAGWRAARGLVRRGRRALVGSVDAYSVEPIAPIAGDADTRVSDLLHSLGSDSDLHAIAALLMDGMTQTEIAADMTISQATVSRLISRIRKIAENM